MIMDANKAPAANLVMGMDQVMDTDRAMDADQAMAMDRVMDADQVMAAGPIAPQKKINTLFACNDKLLSVQGRVNIGLLMMVMVVIRQY